MKNTITIQKSELQQQIDSRNFYMGESAKRKDKDADTIQSSKDDEDLLLTFTHTACNELVTAVALRFPIIRYTIEEESITFEFETQDNRRNHLLPTLARAILDYLVNETTMHWLLLRKPEMAQPYISLRQALFNNAIQMFAKLYNTQRVRRRCTDLGGI